MLKSDGTRMHYRITTLRLSVWFGQYSADSPISHMLGNNYLSGTNDEVYLFIARVFYNDDSLFLYNTTCYTKRVLREWLQEHKEDIPIFSCSQCSPDANPTENICDALDEQEIYLENVHAVTYSS